MLTPTSLPNRSLLQSLKSLPSYTCDLSLLVSTTLHSLLNPLREYITPLILQSYFSVDPILTPTTHSISTFLSRTLEIFIKLPVETVLRRGQANLLYAPHYQTSSHDLQTTVDIGPYKGGLATLWSIIWEEGVRDTDQTGKAILAPYKKPKRGQGVQGLWRGWRVGVWGLVGLYASNALSGPAGASSTGEF